MQLRDTLRFVILACVFLTPFLALIVSETMFFPFITGKNFVFRILVEIALGAWILLATIDAQYRPRKSVILMSAGVFLGIIALADFMGVNPYRSFWSNYERMEGLVTHAHLFLYFIIAGTVLETERLWNWFLRTSLAGSTLVAIHGIAQVLGKAEIHQSDFRIDASLGNATYLAIYALFHLALAFFLWVREREKNPYRWIYLVIAAANLVVLYYTQTRGAILGLIGGAALAFFLVAIFGEKEHIKLRRVAWGSIAALVLLVGSFALWHDSLYKPLVAKSYTLQRMATISLTDLTTSSRFTIWGMSWEGFKERPILGWGQDNFIYVFSKYYDPKMWSQEPWFDRSHDVFFDWLIAGGALGLLSYLALFGSAIWTIWTVGKRRLSVVERAILTGMLAGYFLHNVFVFDNLTSYLLFFGVLAYLHSLAVEDHGEAGDHHANDPKEKGKKKHKKEEWESQDLAIACVVAIVLVGSLLYYVNFRNIDANRELIAALQKPISAGPNNQPVIALEAVIAKPLFGRSEAREQLGNLAFQAMDPRVDQKLKDQVFALAEANLKDEVAHDPENLRYVSFLASLYSRFGRYAEAEAQYKRGLELSPNRQALLLEMGAMYLTTGHIPEAEAAFKKAYELKAYQDGRIFYGIVLIYEGRIDEAENVLAPLKGTPTEFDSRIINAYGVSKHFDKVIMLINEKIARGEATGRDYFSLGGAYAELKQDAKAKEAVQKGIAVDPSLKDQGEAYLKGLK